MRARFTAGADVSVSNPAYVQLSNIEATNEIPVAMNSAVNDEGVIVVSDIGQQSALLRQTVMMVMFAMAQNSGGNCESGTALSAMIPILAQPTLFPWVAQVRHHLR